MPSRCSSKVLEVQLFEALHPSSDIYLDTRAPGRPSSLTSLSIGAAWPESKRVDALVRDRYDYPASCLADIGLALAPVMPTSEPVMDVPAA